MKAIKHSHIRGSLLNTPESQAAYEEAHRAAELSLLLQEIREQAGITRLEIARRMGVTPPVISRLEKNVAKASLHTLERYAMACGTHLKLQFQPAGSLNI